MRIKPITIVAIAVCAAVALAAPGAYARPLTFEDFFGTGRGADSSRAKRTPGTPTAKAVLQLTVMTITSVLMMSVLPV